VSGSSRGGVVHVAGVAEMHGGRRPGRGRGGSPSGVGCRCGVRVMCGSGGVGDDRACGGEQSGEERVARDLLPDRSERLRSLKRQGVMVLDTVPAQLTIDAVNRYLALKTGVRM